MFETDWTMKRKMDEYLYSVLALKENTGASFKSMPALRQIIIQMQGLQKIPWPDYTIGSVHFYTHQQSNQYMALDGTPTNSLKLGTSSSTEKCVV